MPILRQIDFKIRLGTHSSLDDTYLIRNLPMQDDQFPIWWTEPAEATPPHPAETVELANGTILPNGDIVWEWRFSYMTFGMYLYWCDTFLSGGVYSNPVTVQAYDDYDVEGVWQGKMQHRYDQDRTKAPAGYRDVIFRFTEGVKV